MAFGKEEQQLKLLVLVYHEKQLPGMEGLGQGVKQRSFLFMRSDGTQDGTQFRFYLNVNDIE